MSEFWDDSLIENQVGFTAPDYRLYTPKSTEYDHNNVHLYVVEHVGLGGLIAFWTQCTCEHNGDNHVVTAKSLDGGKTWPSPSFVVGCKNFDKQTGERDAQGSWGFPIVSRSGRIYLFYYREIPGVKDSSAQITGAFSCIYSDDFGESWSESGDIPQRKTPYDFREDIQDNIVFELPLRLPDGTYLAGFTKFASRYIDLPKRSCVGVYFYHFKNIDDDPEIKDLQIDILGGDEGIHIWRPNGSMGKIEEPSLARLPDGRIFCSMRTDLGCIFYSVSSDMGRTWAEPKPLAFSDNTFFTHPLSPCPIFDLRDGRFMQLYHGVCDVNRPYHPRNTLRKAIGYFDTDGKQPIRFDKENDSLYMHLDPEEATLGDDVQLAIYGSMTYMNGKKILWYPDRKFFLLGKDVE